MDGFGCDNVLLKTEWSGTVLVGRWMGVVVIKLSERDEFL